MSKQTRMFGHEDLPLFSGAAQRGDLEGFRPAVEVAQSRLFDCPICRGAGSVVVNGTLRRCTCSAGDRPQL